MISKRTPKLDTAEGVLAWAEDAMRVEEPSLPIDRAYWRNEDVSVAERIAECVRLRACLDKLVRDWADGVDTAPYLTHLQEKLLGARR